MGCSLKVGMSYFTLKAEVRCCYLFATPNIYDDNKILASIKHLHQNFVCCLVLSFGLTQNENKQVTHGAVVIFLHIASGKQNYPKPIFKFATRGCVFLSRI